MSAIHDGPSSPHFTPLPLAGNADLPALAAAAATAVPAGMTGKMATALGHAPSGTCTSWGIPFEIGDVVILSDKPVSVEIDPIQARWLVFMHTSDLRPLTPGPGGIISPHARGAVSWPSTPPITSSATPMAARRGSPSAAATRWAPFDRRLGRELLRGGRPPQAPSDPRRRRAAPARLGLDPDARRTPPMVARGSTGCGPGRTPIPRRPIAGFRFEPVAGVVVISAISAGRRRLAARCAGSTRRKARLALPEGEAFRPELDENGLLEQIQLDLGQVISAAPRLVYPNDAWADTYNNQVPELSADRDPASSTPPTRRPASTWLGLGSGSSRWPQVEEAASGRPAPAGSARRSSRSRCASWSAAAAGPCRSSCTSTARRANTWRRSTATASSTRPGSRTTASTSPTSSTGTSAPAPTPAPTSPARRTLELPLGKVYVEVSKGFEIRPVRKVVEVTPGHAGDRRSRSRRCCPGASRAG